MQIKAAHKVTMYSVIFTLSQTPTEAGDHGHQQLHAVSVYLTAFADTKLYSLATETVTCNKLAEGLSAAALKIAVKLIST